MQLDEFRSDGDPRLVSITTLSRRLRWALLGAIGLLAVVLLGVAVALALGLDIGTAHVDFTGTRVPIEDVEAPDVILLLVLVCPGLAVVGAILYQYERLLALYERGTILTADNAMRIRRAGQLMVVLGVFGPIFSLATGIVAARLGWGLSIWELKLDPSLLLAGVANIVIGHVMSIACDISVDADLTI